jgi:hypothetical protein
MQLNTLITGTPIKLQVRLDEDSTPAQILDALDHSLMELSKNNATGAKIQHIVGHLLVHVQDAKLYDGDSFDGWLQKNVQERHGINTRDAWHAISQARHLHITPDQAGKIKVTNINLLAKAVKQAPAAEREKLEKKLLPKAQAMPIKKFEEFVERAGLIRKYPKGERLARVSFEVTQSVLRRWLAIVGERKQGDVFAEIVKGYGRANAA